MQAHADEQSRKHAPCSQCDRLLHARPAVARTVATMGGAVPLERPSVYCTPCRCGHSPFDKALGLTPGRQPLDVQQAAAQVVSAMPYGEAHTLFHDRTGVPMGRERMHPVTNQVAEGLTVQEVAPSREAMERRMASVASGHFRRPVLVLGMDGAYGPTRPEHARGRRPGQGRQRARRARWKGPGREAKGCRFSLMDGDRLVQLISWPQGQTEAERGKALTQVKEASLIPEDRGRLCVVCDGASWIWKHVQALFPHARQVLDDYHGAAYLHKRAKAQYGASVQAVEWVEATLTRLYLGKMAAVRGGVRRMQAHADAAAKAMANGLASLEAHRGRPHYRQWRRGGYPLGSGGIASSNTCICHVRLKRSGAWWYASNRHQRLALRCAKYNGTFDQVFVRHRQRLREA